MFVYILVDNLLIRQELPAGRAETQGCRDPKRVIGVAGQSASSERCSFL